MPMCCWAVAGGTGGVRASLCTVHLLIPMSPIYGIVVRLAVLVEDCVGYGTYDGKGGMEPRDCSFGEPIERKTGSRNVSPHYVCVCGMVATKRWTVGSLNAKKHIYKAKAGAHGCPCSSQVAIGSGVRCPASRGLLTASRGSHLWWAPSSPALAAASWH